MERKLKISDIVLYGMKSKLAFHLLWANNNKICSIIESEVYQGLPDL